MNAASISMPIGILVAALIGGGILGWALFKFAQIRGATRAESVALHERLEAADDMVITVDLDGQVLAANRAARETLGYTLAELQQRAYVDLLSADHAAGAWSQLLAQSEAGPATTHEAFVILTRDGDPRSIESVVRPIRGRGRRLVGLQISARDITDREHAAAALHDSEERLRLAHEVAGIGTCTCHVETGAMAWSDQCYRLLGLEPGAVEPTAEAILSVIVPADRDQVEGELQALTRGLVRQSRRLERRIAVPDGTIRTVEVYDRPILDDAGTVRTVVSTMRDVTDVVATREAVRAVDADLRAAQAIAHVGSYSRDVSTDEIRWSEEMYRVLGLDPRSHELPGDRTTASDRLWAAVHEDDRPALRAAIDLARARREPLAGHRCRIVWPDGTIRTIVVARRDEIRAGIVHQITTVQDVTELTAAHERVADLFENAVDMILTTGPDGQFRTANRAFREQLGYSLEELQEMRLQDIVCEETRATANSRISTAMRDFDPTEVVESCLVRRDGSHIAVEPRMRTLDRSGGEAGIQVTYRDITARKLAETALQRNEARLQSILDSAGDGIITIDERDLVTSFSRGAELIFAYTAVEVVGHNVGMLMGRADREQHDDYLKHYLQTGKSGIIGAGREVVGRHKDGHDIPLDLTIVKAEVDGALMFTGTVRDISAQRAAADRLRDANDQLETALLNANELAAAALQATVAKERFLAHMSHEIRTPMNGIIGMADLLRDTNLDKEQSDYIETVRSSGRALLAIINDILDFSKIESGNIELERIPFDLQAVIADAVELEGQHAREREVDLLLRYDPQCPHWFVGDPGRLRQILLNLISNALKFTEAGYVLAEVQAVGTDPDQPRVRISVTDTGIGISEGDLSALFEEFTQADTSTTRKYGGTGLGLAISKNLIELMGGWIGATSRVGEGSTFSFELPLEAATPTEGDAASVSRIDARVLVMDDRPLGRDTTLDQILTWGMRATATGSADETLDTLQSAERAGDPFDLVLLRHAPPAIDGLVAAGRIREDSTLDRVRLILLTSSAAAPRSEIAFAARLSLPVGPSRLMNAITDALGTRALIGANATTVPGADLVHLEAAPVGHYENAPPRGRVLVVEDNATNQKVALRMLKRLGYAADLAENGRIALETLRTTSYDVVLMDGQMPEMDGYEATQQIRAQIEDGGPTIIAMTANALPEDREHCFAVGMNDYLTKPVELHELDSMLKRWIASDAPALDGDLAWVPPEPVQQSEHEAQPEEAQPDETPDSPAVDRERLEMLGLLDGGEEAALADEFGEDARELFHLMQAALKRGDAEQLRGSAHALKGSSGNLGAVRLSDLAAELEQLARDGALERATALIKQIDAELDRVIDALRDLEAAA